jgi:hypothetical protein
MGRLACSGCALALGCGRSIEGLQAARLLAATIRRNAPDLSFRVVE